MNNLEQKLNQFFSDYYGEDCWQWWESADDATKSCVLYTLQSGLVKERNKIIESLWKRWFPWYRSKLLRIDSQLDVLDEFTVYILKKNGVKK